MGRDSASRSGIHGLCASRAILAVLAVLTALCVVACGGRTDRAFFDDADSGADGPAPPSSSGADGAAPPSSGGPKYTIGGIVSGLSGSGLILQNRSQDDLPVTQNGAFTFATPASAGMPYEVKVLQNPSNPTQTCSVAGAAGTVHDGNVSNVTVACTTDKFTVGGTVAGLAGTGLVLQINGGDNLPISASGAFTFATPVASGTAFSVTVSAQPANPSQSCTVTGGAATVGAGNVTSVTVNCGTNKYTIGGTVTGLLSGALLQNNGGDDLNVTANGTFAFATPLDSGATYAVTVKSQPSVPSQTCTPTTASGSVGGANVTNVALTCVTNKFTVGGTVTGLSGTGLVLKNNGGDNLPVDASGAFTFATSIASGATFSVTVGSQPTNPSQTCTVTGGGSGTMGASNVSAVTVACTKNKYTIGGVVTGLLDTAVLQNNTGDDLNVTANGAFTFPTAIESGAAYAVTVKTQPGVPSQTCTLLNASGSVGGANVTNVALSCTTNKFSVGGTVAGLSGAGLVLKNNGGDSLPVGASGAFAFATTITSGAAFSVTVGAQPTNPSQTCSVTGGTGNVGAGNVTSVAINCTTDKFTIGGSANGVLGTAVLQVNGGDDLDVSANGAFAFATPIDSGAAYAVTVKTQPGVPSQTCALTSAVGNVGAANVTSVALSCTTNKFKVGGTLAGLPASTTVVLQNNAADNLSLTQNGAFQFGTSIASGAAYDVSVLTSPAHYTCSATSATGVVGAQDVAGVTVTCAVNKYSIGGAASGVIGAGLVLLNQTNAESLAVNANGAFTFLQVVPSQGPYNVKVSASPLGRSCVLQSGAGTMGDANVTDMSVACRSYSQNFDAVVAPALPADWTAAITGVGTAWTTVSTGADTAPNAAFAADPAVITDNILTSPAYAIQTATAKLTFRHVYDFEAGISYYDGGVLEVSADGAAFQDILAAGGTFAVGGYTAAATLSTCCSNPLGGRAAWAGKSAGSPAYATTTVNLPAAFVGKAVRFRWRLGTDSSNLTAVAGWWIDTITITP